MISVSLHYLCTQVLFLMLPESSKFVDHPLKPAGLFHSRTAIFLSFVGAGMATVMLSFLLATYYNVILTWALYYLFHCFQVRVGFWTKRFPYYCLWFQVLPKGRSIDFLLCGSSDSSKNNLYTSTGFLSANFVFLLCLWPLLRWKQHCLKSVFGPQWHFVEPVISFTQVLPASACQKNRKLTESTDWFTPFTRLIIAEVSRKPVHFVKILFWQLASVVRCFWTKRFWSSGLWTQLYNVQQHKYQEQASASVLPCSLFARLVKSTNIPCSKKYGIKDEENGGGGVFLPEEGPLWLWPLAPSRSRAWVLMVVLTAGGIAVGRLPPWLEHEQVLGQLHRNRSHRLGDSQPGVLRVGTGRRLHEFSLR